MVPFNTYTSESRRKCLDLTAVGQIIGLEMDSEWKFASIATNGKGFFCVQAQWSLDKAGDQPDLLL